MDLNVQDSDDFQGYKDTGSVSKRCPAAKKPMHKYSAWLSSCYSWAVLPLRDHADTLGQFVMYIRGAAKVTGKDIRSSISQHFVGTAVSAHYPPMLRKTWWEKWDTIKAKKNVRVKGLKVEWAKKINATELCYTHFFHIYLPMQWEMAAPTQKTRTDISPRIRVWRITDTAAPWSF